MSKRRAVFAIHYRYWGELRPDPARRHEIAFARYDPYHVDGERSHTYENFTVASAQRVRRLLEGGGALWVDDRGAAYRDFQLSPWELTQGDSMTRYAKKVDTNHSELRDQLRAIPGMRLLDTAAMSGLGCDLLCRWQDGPPVMLEIKSAAKKPLTDSERRAQRLFDGYWHRVETLEDALEVFGISAERAPF